MEVDVEAVRLLLRRGLMRNASHSPLSSFAATTSSIVVVVVVIVIALQQVDSLLGSSGKCVLLVPL